MDFLRASPLYVYAGDSLISDLLLKEKSGGASGQDSLLHLHLTLRGCTFSSNPFHAMQDSANSADIALLRTNPHELLVRYQSTIRMIVRAYIHSGMFHPSEFDDVVQHLNKEILEKLPRIQKQYNGMSLFRTYFSNIVRHACLSLNTERESKPVRLELYPAFHMQTAESPDHRLLIEHDIHVFRAILDQFHSEKPKLLLCLKLLYRVPINRLDVVNWWPDCPESDINALLGSVPEERMPMTTKDMFVLLQPLMNRAEMKNTSADSIRHWVDSRIQAMLSLLNGSPPTSAHTRETLGVLLEDYCAPFLLS